MHADNLTHHYNQDEESSCNGLRQSLNQWQHNDRTQLAKDSTTTKTKGIVHLYNPI